MGINPQKEPTFHIPTDLTNSLDYILAFQGNYKTVELISSIRIILKQISYLSVLNQQKKLRVNQVYMQIVLHANINSTTTKLMNFASTKITEVFQRNIQFISKQSLLACLETINMLIIITNEHERMTLSTLRIRNDVDPETIQYLNKLSPEEESQHLPFDASDLETQTALEKSLRLSLSNTTKLKSKIMMRSSHTERLIYSLECCMFSLYTKMVFSRHQRIVRKMCQQDLNAIMAFSEYFIGLGIDRNKPILLDTAIILLLQAIKNRTNKQIPHRKSLPSHIFAKLPLVTSGGKCEVIVVYLLFAICQGLGNSKQKKFVTSPGTNHLEEDSNEHMKIRQRSQEYHLGNIFINRILAYKLVIILLTNIKDPHNQITYYLEKLSLHIDPTHIQFAFVIQAVKLYCAINPESPLLKIFSKNADITYKVRYCQHILKVNAADVVTELQNDNESMRKEYEQVSWQFMKEEIFMQRVQPFHTDKQLWAQMLPSLLQGDYEQVQLNKKIG